MNCALCGGPLTPNGSCFRYLAGTQDFRVLRNFPDLWVVRIARPPQEFYLHIENGVGTMLTEAERRNK